MLALILGFVTGLLGPVAQVVNKITDLKMQRAKAESDKELAKIDAELQEVHDRKAVLIAEAGNRITGTMNGLARFALALGPIVILLKFLVWDKTVGSFSGCAKGSSLATDERCYTFNTDSLDPNMWWVILTCVAFYFLTSKPRN